MRLFVLIGLIVLLSESAKAAVLLGSNRCTWGPSYWCAHLGTMKQCKSTSYCSRLWQREAKLTTAGGATPDTSEDCSFCRLLASDLARLSRANRTRADTRRLATSACGLVPEARQRALCLAVVDNYVDEAVQLLREGLGADRLCSALSLCGAGRRDPKLHVGLETTQPPPSRLVRVPLGKPGPSAAVDGRLRDGVCNLCLEFVTIVKLAAENKATEVEVAQVVKAAVCAKLSSGQAMCNLWIDSYVPEVMRMLADKTDPARVCAAAKFCPAAAAAPTGKFQRHPLMQLMILQKLRQKPLKGVECQVCEMLVSEARQMLRDNKTQDEIVEFLKDRVCGLIPAEKDKCIQAVTEYAPIIFQLLASELDPNAVCQALGACGKTAAAAAAPSRSPRIGPQCILCEYVIRELDQLLGSNRTEAAIQGALESVCSIMPQTIRQDCDAWVRQYTPAVLQLLSQDLSPALVCTVLGLCTGQQKPPVPAAPAAALTSAPTATACDICQTVILYVKSLLKENATEQEVKDVLEKVCNFLPSAEQSACRDFVEQYTAYIIQLLLQDVDPKQICQAIGLCPQAAAARSAGRLRYRPEAAGPARLVRARVNDPLV